MYSDIVIQLVGYYHLLMCVGNVTQFDVGIHVNFTLLMSLLCTHITFALCSSLSRYTHVTFTLHTSLSRYSHHFLAAHVNLALNTFTLHTSFSRCTLCASHCRYARHFHAILVSFTLHISYAHVAAIFFYSIRHRCRQK